MSKSTKLMLSILVLLIVAGGLYYWFVYRAGMTPVTGAEFNESSTTLPSGSSTTDTSLQQDTAAIDAQLKGLSSDSTSVQSSMDESAQTQ